MGIHDEHLAAAIGVLVEHSATGVRAERDGIVVTSVGSGGPEFNTAWVTRRPADPASVAWARDALSETGQPWMLQGSVEALDGLDLGGLGDGVGVPLMVRPATTTTPPLPDQLRIAVATDGDDVLALGRAMSTGFGSPDPDAMSAALPASLLDDDRITLIGGWLGDDLVATSVGVVAHGVGGIYGVTVQPEARRRGIGAAVTWAAVGAVSDRVEDVVLQASAMGESVYRAMGFETVSWYRRLR